MAIFKRKFTNKNGKEKALKKYSVEFRDHDGIVRRIPAFTDRSASAELERQLKRLVAMRMAGAGLDTGLSVFLESCPGEIRDKLANWGVIEQTISASGKNVATHIADWRVSMRANGLSRKQVVNNLSKVERITKECGWKTLSDINVADMEKWRLAAKEGGMSLMTTNHYLAAAKAFCNWLVKEKRLVTNPLEHMRKLNAATDRRRERRAFVIDELGKILAAAKDGPYTHGLTGYQRYLLYRVAVSTGYRWSEIKSFRKSSINFESTPVTLAIKAEHAKNGLDDALPLPDDLAAELKQHLALHLPDALIFPGMDGHGAEMLRVDLKAAGVPYVDEYGRVGDFHAFRHTFGTLGAKAGIPLATMQKLMRHSTPTLTANLYTHILLSDKAEELKKMPLIGLVVECKTTAATGTCDSAPNLDKILDSPIDRFSSELRVKTKTYRDSKKDENRIDNRNQRQNNPLQSKGLILAEREGFEPPGACAPAVFKTAAFDHSAISPVFPSLAPLCQKHRAKHKSDNPRESPLQLRPTDGNR